MDNTIIIHKSDMSGIEGFNIVINDKIDRLLPKEAIESICTKDANQIYSVFCKHLPILTLSKLQDLINNN